MTARNKAATLNPSTFEWLASVQPAAERMKIIAAESGDALYLCNGPVQPDHALLDLCSDARHYAKAAELAYNSRSRLPRNEGLMETADDRRRRPQACMRKRCSFAYRKRALPSWPCHWPMTSSTVQGFARASGRAGERAYETFPGPAALQRGARRTTTRLAADLAPASAKGSLEAVPARPKPPHRYVYVIGPAAGLQKVGIATDPRSRLAALQTAVTFNLVLHAAVRAPFAQAHAVERRAHRLLADVCARNEWVHATPEEAIAAVREAANPPKPVPPEWGPANVLAKALPLFAYRR